MSAILKIIVIDGVFRYSDSGLWKKYSAGWSRTTAIRSRNAASTYNILNEERRLVAATVLPYGAQD
ncbi:hypothetical protein EJ110_NYTH24812 [Nymphaea thermarum]|nr:hypothetical protein EJ110_NYTH24812 [Nymphaea thermarum]